MMQRNTKQVRTRHLSPSKDTSPGRVRKHRKRRSASQPTFFEAEESRKEMVPDMRGERLSRPGGERERACVLRMQTSQGTLVPQLLEAPRTRSFFFSNNPDQLTMPLRTCLVLGMIDTSANRGSKAQGAETRVVSGATREPPLELRMVGREVQLSQAVGQARTDARASSGAATKGGFIR